MLIPAGGEILYKPSCEESPFDKIHHRSPFSALNLVRPSGMKPREILYGNFTWTRYPPVYIGELDRHGEPSLAGTAMISTLRWTLPTRFVHGYVFHFELAASLRVWWEGRMWVVNAPATATPDNRHRHPGMRLGVCLPPGLKAVYARDWRRGKRAKRTHSVYPLLGPMRSVYVVHTKQDDSRDKELPRLRRGARDWQREEDQPKTKTLVQGQQDKQQDNKY